MKRELFIIAVLERLDTLVGSEFWTLKETCRKLIISSLSDVELKEENINLLATNVFSKLDVKPTIKSEPIAYTFSQLCSLNLDSCKAFNNNMYNNLLQTIKQVLGKKGNNYYEDVTNDLLLWLAENQTNFNYFKSEKQFKNRVTEFYNSYKFVRVQKKRINLFSHAQINESM